MASHFPIRGPGRLPSAATSHAAAPRSCLTCSFCEICLTSGSPLLPSDVSTIRQQRQDALWRLGHPALPARNSTSTSGIQNNMCWHRQRIGTKSSREHIHCVPTTRNRVLRFSSQLGKSAIRQTQRTLASEFDSQRQLSLVS